MNAYLREATGGDFSAKDFRTWFATVTCSTELEAAGIVDTQAQAKQMVVAALTATAKRLGNTPAVCRKAYVHPVVIERYLDEHRLDLPKLRASRKPGGLDLQERRVLAFLEHAQEHDADRVRLHALERSVAAAKAKRAHAG